MIFNRISIETEKSKILITEDRFFLEDPVKEVGSAELEILEEDDIIKCVSNDWVLKELSHHDMSLLCLEKQTVVKDCLLDINLNK